MPRQILKNMGIKLPPGTVVTGKWHKQRYRLNQQLGQGAIGAVYLTEKNGLPAAIKISEKRTSITLEVNVLQSLNKVQGSALGPYLLDTDDWLAPDGVSYTFYVMEYIKGSSLTYFLEKRGQEWLPVLVLGLLQDLDTLHQTGWVFGDLKTENLVVRDAPPRLRWVDVGGTTQIGRAIKEYTEFYDRGYWKKGSRKAEPSYDLFAVAMIILEIHNGGRFTREQGLQGPLGQTKKLQPIIQKALEGKYHSAEVMKRHVSRALLRRPHVKSQHKTSILQKKRKKKVKKKAPLGELLLLLGCTMLLCLLYLYVQR